MHHHNDALLGTLSQRLDQEDLFDRNRKQPDTRALALLLHHAGLSCRRTSQLVTLLAEPVTHAPISAWYRRASHLFRDQPARRHEQLVIDETSLQLERANGDLKEVFLWAAIDPDTQQLVHVTVTEGRGGIEALGFLNGVLARCDNRPFIHVDRGVWYPWPLELLGLD